MRPVGGALASSGSYCHLEALCALLRLFLSFVYYLGVRVAFGVLGGHVGL